MKQVLYWACGYCGTQYADEKSCRQCEDQHLLPEKIISAEHRPMKVCAKYPPRLRVKFSDGSSAIYSLTHGGKRPNE